MTLMSCIVAVVWTPVFLVPVPRAGLRMARRMDVFTRACDCRPGTAVGHVNCMV